MVESSCLQLLIHLVGVAVKMIFNLSCTLNIGYVFAQLAVVQVLRCSHVVLTLM